MEILLFGLGILFGRVTCLSDVVLLMIRLFSNIIFSLFIFRLFSANATILPPNEWSWSVIHQWIISGQIFYAIACFLVSTAIFYWCLDRIDAKLFEFIFNLTKQRIRESTPSGKKKERKAARCMLGLDLIIKLRPAIIFIERVVTFGSKREVVKETMDEFMALGIKSIPYLVHFAIALFIFGVRLYFVYGLIVILLLSNILYCFVYYPKLKLLKITL